jgi:hypothetical protein
VTARLLLVLLLSQDRPVLPAGLDTNDWVSYQGQGLKEIDRHPEVALSYFAFAARLDPSVAEPLLGQYAAWWRLHKKLQNRLWEHPDRALSDTVQADSVLSAERWRDEADLRNPFAPQAVLTWAAPKRILLNPWDPFQLGLAAFFRGDWNQTILCSVTWSAVSPTAWVVRSPRTVIAHSRWRTSGGGATLRTISTRYWHISARWSGPK